MDLKQSFLISLAAAALVSGQATAGEKSGFTVDAMVGYLGLDSDVEADDTEFGTLGLGYRFNSHWATELDYSLAELSVDGVDTEFDSSILSLNALYHFSNKDTKVDPYALIGFGHQTIDNTANDAENSVMNAGFGLKVALTEALNLRTEYRHIRDLDNELNHDAIGIGLHYLFGGKSKTVASKPLATAPAKKPLLDEDNDGITDDIDQCLGTPMGVQVDSTGCPPKDSDNDGVVDANDKCPGSSAGSKVDSDGCYVIISSVKEIELEVAFENNSSTVTQSSHSEIENVANFLKEYPLTNVVIEGHTDDRGSAAYNLKLSQSRAEAVAQELVERYDVDPSRVSAKGYGEDQPRASNDTAEGRAKNRRVTAKVSATVEEIEKQ